MVKEKDNKDKPVDILDGLEVLYRRADSSLKCYNDVTELFRKIAHSEADSAKSLTKISKDVGEKTVLSHAFITKDIRRALSDGVLGHLSAFAASQQEFSLDLLDLSTRIQTYLKDMETAKKRLVNEAQMLKTQINNHYQSVSKVKNQYFKCAKEVESYRISLNKALEEDQNLQKVQQANHKFVQSSEKCEEALGLYRLQLADSNSEIDQIYTFHVPLLIEKFQRLDDDMAKYMEERIGDYAAKIISGGFGSPQILKLIEAAEPITHIPLQPILTPPVSTTPPSIDTTSTEKLPSTETEANAVTTPPETPTPIISPQRSINEETKENKEASTNTTTTTTQEQHSEHTNTNTNTISNTIPTHKQNTPLVIALQKFMKLSQLSFTTITPILIEFEPYELPTPLPPTINTTNNTTTITTTTTTTAAATTITPLPEINTTQPPASQNATPVTVQPSSLATTFSSFISSAKAASVDPSSFVRRERVASVGSAPTTSSLVSVSSTSSQSTNSTTTNTGGLVSSLLGKSPATSNTGLSSFLTSASGAKVSSFLSGFKWKGEEEEPSSRLSFSSPKPPQNLVPATIETTNLTEHTPTETVTIPYNLLTPTVLQNIFSTLSVADLDALSLVNKQWEILVRQDERWKKLVLYQTNADNIEGQLPVDPSVFKLWEEGLDLPPQSRGERYQFWLEEHKQGWTNLVDSSTSSAYCSDWKRLFKKYGSLSQILTFKPNNVHWNSSPKNSWSNFDSSASVLSADNSLLIPTVLEILGLEGSQVLLYFSPLPRVYWLVIEGGFISQNAGRFWLCPDANDRVIEHPGVIKTSLIVDKNGCLFNVRKTESFHNFLVEVGIPYNITLSEPIVANSSLPPLYSQILHPQIIRILLATFHFDNGHEDHSFYIEPLHFFIGSSHSIPQTNVFDSSSGLSSSSPLNPGRLVPWFCYYDMSRPPSSESKDSVGKLTKTSGRMIFIDAASEFPAENSEKKKGLSSVTSSYERLSSTQYCYATLYRHTIAFEFNTVDKKHGVPKLWYLEHRKEIHEVSQYRRLLSQLKADKSFTLVHEEELQALADLHGTQVHSLSYGNPPSPLTTYDDSWALVHEERLINFERGSWLVKGDTQTLRW